MTRDSTSRIPYLPLALLAALILSLLPSRFLRWTEPVSEPLDAVIAPIAQAGTTAARWLRPPRSTNYSSEDEPVIEDLRAEIEKFRTHALNLEAQLRRLKAESEELRQARLLNPGSHDMLLDFPVIRGSSEMGSSFIKIKGGRNRGIINGAVAVYRGVHLVGRVIRVEAVTSTIQPITDAGADYIECVIMPPGNDV
ncbi:MAG TPA: hypothetical protein ENJ06_05100, partial [Phycisphaeraceae bacterium]|nr:hypothetical protein [Phycisphaeraceae bacterium]